MRRTRPPTAAEARALANRSIDGLCPSPMEKWQVETAESFRLDIDVDESVPTERIVDDLRDLLGELE